MFSNGQLRRAEIVKTSQMYDKLYSEEMAIPSI